VRRNYRQKLGSANAQKEVENEGEIGKKGTKTTLGLAALMVGLGFTVAPPVNCVAVRQPLHGPCVDKAHRRSLPLFCSPLKSSIMRLPVAGMIGTAWKRERNAVA